MTIIRALTLASLLASTLAAQTPSPAPAPQAKEAEPDLATLRAMKSKVFVVQHRDSYHLMMSLDGLGSGAKGAQMRWAKQDDGPSTITVRDFPENLASIEEAIKRLDVPSASRKAADVELIVHVLFASKAPVAEADLPGDLREVVKQLKGTLAYRGYTLAASFVQRVSVNGDRIIQGHGQLEGNALAAGSAKEPTLLNMDWESNRGVSLESTDGGTARYFLRKFQFKLWERRGTGSENLAQLETDITLKDGEKVVVGTSVVKDRGLIVVLSARRVD